MLVFEETIISSVNEDIESMQYLIDILIREQEALLNDSLNQIELLTPIKSDIIHGLSKSNDVRMSAFLSFNKTESFIVWLEKHNDPVLVVAWAELMSLTCKAKEFNSINSLLLNQLAVRNQGYLSFFKGDNQEKTLYGRDGFNCYKSKGLSFKG